MVPEGPGPRSGPAAPVAHSRPLVRGPCTGRGTRASSARSKQPASGSVAQEPPAAGSAEMRVREGRRGDVSELSPPAPRHAALPRRGNLERKVRPSQSAKTAKKAKVPTGSTWTRLSPQYPIKWCSIEKRTHAAEGANQMPSRRGTLKETARQRGLEGPTELGSCCVSYPEGGRDSGRCHLSTPAPTSCP